MEMAESEQSAYEEATKTILGKTDELLTEDLTSIPKINVGKPQLYLDTEYIEEDVERCIEAFTGILTFMQKPVLCVCDRFGDKENCIITEFVGWETKAVLGHIRFDLMGETVNFQTDMYYCPEALDLLAEILKNFSKIFPMRVTIQAIIYEPIEMAEDFERVIDDLTIEGKVSDYRTKWEKIAFDKPPWDFSEIKVSKEDKDVISKTIGDYMQTTPFARILSRIDMKVAGIELNFWELGYLVTLYIKPKVIRPPKKVYG